MANKLAAALKKVPQAAAPEQDDPQAGPAKRAPSRANAKHVGGYFDPAVAKQLKAIAVEEDASVQLLLGEALDMLFQARGKPMIASRK